jgi:hypothetical protein
LFDFRFLFPPVATGAGAAPLVLAGACFSVLEPNKESQNPPLCELFLCELFLCEFLCEGILYNIETKQFLQNNIKIFS